jgi:hypothetical protein
MSTERILAAIAKLEQSMASIADFSRLALLLQAAKDSQRRPVQIQMAVEYCEEWL